MGVGVLLQGFRQRLESYSSNPGGGDFRGSVVPLVPQANAVCSVFVRQ